MTTSIMLVTYNRLELTKRMLDSFFKNTTSPYRFIVVDNGSSDGTPEFLTSLQVPASCVGYEYFLSPSNLGIAVGRNVGLQMADKHFDDWLSTVDNDIEFAPGWLEECIGIMQANPNFAIGVNMENTMYPIITQNGKSFQFKPRGNLGTACTVFPRKLHVMLGFFNTEYGLYGEEDADFFIRARMMGFQLGYLKQSGIHFGEGELDEGEYREFKTQCHARNLAKFQQNCAFYANGSKPIYIPFTEEHINKTQ